VAKSDTMPGERGWLPGVNDLAEWVFFAPATGRIWFDKQRSLLMHANTFGAMRREIIQAMGVEQGRMVLKRIGHAQGQRDAELVRERWPAQGDWPARSAGPQLHTLEGFVKVSALGWKTTPEHGYHGEYIWTDSVEADEHVAAFGQAAGPVCWSLAGYAEGYAGFIHGGRIVVEEVECVAAGHPHCRAIVRHTEDCAADASGSPGGGSAGRASAAACLGDGAVAEPKGRSIIGVSAPLTGARRLLEQVAGTRASVLLRGESGVGKELFATSLHQISPRRDKPFVAVNCAAIPEDLVESELFGVERGAFTGATASRPGRFERADGGTLFLDEIGLMSPAAQAKLLRVLQNHEIERVGGTRSLRIDVRVVAATNVDLWEEVQAHRFRPDLFYRLNVFPIDLPPLRSRRNDIPLLIDHFTGFYADLHGKRVRGLTRAALETLLNYDYPGNIRELQNLIERGVICAQEGELIDRAHIFCQGETFARLSFVLGDQGRLQSSEASGAEVSPSAEGGWASCVSEAGPCASLEAIEQRLCLTTVEACGGNVALAARRLGMTRPTLAYRLRKWTRAGGEGSPIGDHEGSWPGGRAGYCRAGSVEQTGR
jgi:DNA-binding NtrC family response regulator/predicted hydrocarbon binding protein